MAWIVVDEIDGLALGAHQDGWKWQRPRELAVQFVKRGDAVAMCKWYSNLFHKQISVQPVKLGRISCRKKSQKI